MIATGVKNGADLESKVAQGGTVRLTVDHAEVSYSVDVQQGYQESDFQEIHAYLLEHDFVLLDEDECPVEESPTGWRVWACHKYGEEFGSASLKPVLSVVAAILAMHLVPFANALVAI